MNDFIALDMAIGALILVVVILYTAWQEAIARNTRDALATVNLNNERTQ